MNCPAGAREAALGCRPLQRDVFGSCNVGRGLSPPAGTAHASVDFQEELTWINTNEILDTIHMIDQQHLDVRTITMGISLL
ncbi:MAG: hypothetical protein ACLRWQ_06540 [Flavonifractor plautii]